MCSLCIRVSGYNIRGPLENCWFCLYCFWTLVFGVVKLMRCCEGSSSRTSHAVCVHSVALDGSFNL